MKVYNTLTKRKEEFRPLKDNEIRMYVCGPTVYDYPHIGHARTYVAFDIIRRYLLYRGYKVKFVMNITNVDDKIIKRANELGKDPLELADEFEKIFFEDIERLNIERADVHPRVTDHIKDIINLVEKLIERGYAYVSDGDVYFEVSKFKDYGKLSKQSLEEIKAGARVEVNPKKRNPADFALWKKAKPNEPYWHSPWGKGRPGWHIECSAMSMKYLGESFDIHGGAQDLIFPHHENEIAQSEAATGKQFVRYWIHTGLLTVNGEKMSKSLGNFITIRDFLKKYDANVLRVFFLQTHYRSPIDFSWKKIEESKAIFERIRSFYQTLILKAELKREDAYIKNLAEELKKKFEDSMDNDFATPEALASLLDTITKFYKYLAESDAGSFSDLKDVVEKIIEIFGLRIEEPRIDKAKLENILEEFGKEARGCVAELIDEILRLRNELRAKKDFKKADCIRSKLNEAGIIIDDIGKRSVWRVA